MRFEMSTGNHEPAGQHYVKLNDRGRLMDLSQINGTLHDPTISKVTWGIVTRGAESREGGMIYRAIGGKPQAFFDKGPLKPYLAAFKAAENADAGILPPENSGD